MEVYAAYSTDLNERKSSSSGGIFSLLAKRILKEGGIVYGVAMSDDCKSTLFVRIDQEKYLHKLKGAKYLQANIDDTFTRVKNDLAMGKRVLFSGTACQINGLKGFLGKPEAQLICVDVVCHGVPSPALWRKYVAYQEKINRGYLAEVNFRCKEEIQSDRESGNSEKGRTIFSSMKTDPFMMMFLRDYSLRPSCYSCKVKEHKQSDLSIADFWGISQLYPDMNDGKGTSLIVTRTEVGEAFFQSISSGVVLKRVSYDEAVRYNPAEYSSVIRPMERDIFFRDLNSIEFEQMITTYCKATPVSIRKKLKQYFHRIRNKKTEGASWEAYGLLLHFKEWI